MEEYRRGRCMCICNFFGIMSRRREEADRMITGLNDKKHGFDSIK